MTAETSPEQWIVIPNWERFQHYKDRTPPWIKLYTAELAHNPDWCRLGLSQKGLLVTLWVEFALSRGRIDPSRVRAITGLRNLYQTLEPLVQAGFVELSASKPLALARSREEDSKESSKKKHRRRRASSEPRAAGEEKQAALAEAAQLAGRWNGGDSDAFAQAIDEIAERHQVRIGDAERIDLWTSAFEW